ncbi:MAG: hypothetical protein RIF32_17425, partial [Leptospirales bacterium]
MIRCTLSITGLPPEPGGSTGSSSDGGRTGSLPGRRFHVWALIAAILVFGGGPRLTAQNILDELQYETADELQKEQIEY